MTKYSSAALVLAVALGVIGTAIVFASRPVDAYPAAAERLSLADFSHASSRQFHRADLDGSGLLEQEEFVALAVVSAELARLNGFVALDGHKQLKVLDLPNEDNLAAPDLNRRRIEQSARAIYADLAFGGPGILESSYVIAREVSFRKLDQDQDNSLSGPDLGRLAIALTHPAPSEQPTTDPAEIDQETGPFIGILQLGGD